MVRPYPESIPSKINMLIHKYNPEWIKWFEAIQKELSNALGDMNYQIEHVGSTAVPDLDAKPIIDIDIIYKDEILFDKIKDQLTGIGYYHNGDQGIEHREVFKRKSNQTHQVLDKIKHHLYACLEGSPGLQRHLWVRNALRENNDARLEYQRLKYEIAALVNQDKKEYAQLKEARINHFLDGVISDYKDSIGSI